MPSFSCIVCKGYPEVLASLLHTVSPNSLLLKSQLMCLYFPGSHVLQAHVNDRCHDCLSSVWVIEAALEPHHVNDILISSRTNLGKP